MLIVSVNEINGVLGHATEIGVNRGIIQRLSASFHVATQSHASINRTCCYPYFTDRRQVPNPFINNHRPTH